MRNRVVSAVLIATAVPSGLAAQGVTVDHAAVGCVVAERFPRFQARIDPAASVARALVHFRTDPARPWYAVAMKPEGPAFSGVLPKPKKSLKSFQYYIDVTDRAFATSRTPEHTTQVVRSGTECQGGMMAGAVGSASVLLEVPAGAPAVPAGFASAGVAAAGSATAVAAAGAAAGGGIGAGTVAAIVGGGAALAGAAVAVSAASGGDEGGDGGSGDGRRSTLYSVTFGGDGIDVSVCAGRPLRWCCQNVSADTSGRFDLTWAPNEPNTARVSGTVTETAFNATIACTSGAATGSISATGSGGTYQGSFNFPGSGGSVTVRRIAE
jgi:hypothetical protein